MSAIDEHFTPVESALALVSAVDVLVKSVNKVTEQVIAQTAALDKACDLLYKVIPCFSWTSTNLEELTEIQEFLAERGYIIPHPEAIYNK
jgi:hypothetical protein